MHLYLLIVGLLMKISKTSSKILFFGRVPICHIMMDDKLLYYIFVGYM
jgi:hypothetical protein